MTDGNPQSENLESTTAPGSSTNPPASQESSEAKERLRQLAEQQRRERPREPEPKPIGQSLRVDAMRKPFDAAAYEEQQRKKLELEQQQETTRRARLWDSVRRQFGDRYATGLDAWEFHGSREERQKQWQAVETIKDYALNLRANVNLGVGVVLYGPVGTGKDLMLAHLLRAACREGISAQWHNCADLYGRIRDNIDSERSEESLIRDLAGQHVLALSDVLPPFGDLTQFQSATLFRVLDRRYRHRQPIWATINIADGVEGASRMGIQLMERLKDGAAAVQCFWSSYRKALTARPIAPCPENL